MNLETMTLISKAAQASQNITWDSYCRKYAEDYKSPYTDEEIEKGKALIQDVNERLGTDFTWEDPSD